MNSALSRLRQRWYIIAASAPQPQTPTPAPEPGPSTPAPSSAARLRFDRNQVSATPGARITLHVLADNVTDLFAAPLKINFDPKALHLIDLRRGALLANDGQDVIFSKNVLNDTGEASINLSRFPGSGGVSGSGVLLTLEFEAASAATTSVSISNIAARNPNNDPIRLDNTQAEVTVK